MKRKLLSLFLLMIGTIGTLTPAKAMTYKESLATTEPVAIFIYANWADKVFEAKQNFDSMNSLYSKTYNFVALDIASEDTKIYNKKYHIYPNLPYVILSRDNGRISRYITKDCVLDNSCLREKMKLFVN